jgi:hypothetical protein
MVIDVLTVASTQERKVMTGGNADNFPVLRLSANCFCSAVVISCPC